MKAKYLALSLLACVGMASCSDSDNLVGGDGQGSATSTSYLAVNIMNVGNTGSRGTDGGYTNGSGTENEIGDLRFYLFDANDNAYTQSNGKSYVEPIYTNEQEQTGNVEEIGEALLAIEGTPASIVALANAPTGLANTYKLEDLKKVLAGSYQNGDSKFIMSSSVYMAGAEEACAVPISGHIASKEEDAKNNPVEIYIERLAAKVQATFTAGDDDKTIDGCAAFKVKDDGYSDGDLYAKVLGWTLVSAPDNSFLVKNIVTSWSDQTLGFTWNAASDHRSFWAQMPSSGVSFPTNFTLEGVANAAGASVYTLENTSDNNKTNLLVKAQLVKEDGTATSLYKYMGYYYGDDGAVLTAILPSFLDNEKEYYVKTSEGTEATSYSTLRVQDLKFVSGASLEDEKEDNSYRAYPQLKDAFEGVASGEETNVYQKNGEGQFELANKDEVNAALKDYPAQIWEEGYCYYFTPIQHLGTSYGVVRNHMYQVNITDIVGFGTPVYNPSEEIVKPVQPKDDNSYLSAKVNILSWKVVNSSVTLQ